MGFPIFKTGNPLVVPPYSPITTVLSGEAGGMGGGGGEEPANYLSLPLYHEWQGESDGAMPSYCISYTGDPGSEGQYEQATVRTDPGSCVSTWGKTVPKHTSGSKDCVAMLDLAAGDDTTAGIDPSLDDIRVVLACRADHTFDYWQVLLHDGLGWGPSVTANALYFNRSENGRDFRWRQVVDGVESYYYQTPGTTGTYASGGKWHYQKIRWVRKGTTGGLKLYNASQSDCLDDAGNLYNYPYQIANPDSGAEAFPNSLRYLSWKSYTWSRNRVCQVWVGTGEWPSLPMTPASNLGG